jgi:hypothetical protein
MEVSTKTTVEVGDPLDDPFGGRGEIVSRSPTEVVWRGEVEPGVVAFCKKTITDPLFESNKQLLNESEGKKFGDGKIVARVDLPTYYSTILPAIQAGDDAWVKKWFNASENRRYRTFRGKI